MGLSRTNIVLVIVLLAQIGIAAFVYLGNDDDSPPLARGGDLLRDFDATRYLNIVIESETDQRLELARVDGAWVLPSADNYPAQASRIDELLATIERIEADQLITRTDTSHRRLQVADDAYYRKITLSQADGNSQTLYVGVTGGGRTRHVRLAGEDAVYLTDEFASGQLDVVVTSWINTIYFSLPTDQITAIRIENANGTTQIIRADAQTWRVDGLAPNRITDAVAINPLVSALGNFRLLQPLGTTQQADYGMDDPTAVVTITLEIPAATDESAGMIDGAPTQTPTQIPSAEAPAPTIQTYTLTLGAATETAYYAKYSESPYYVQVTTSMGDLWINATPETLSTSQIFAVFGG